MRGPIYVFLAGTVAVILTGAVLLLTPTMLSGFVSTVGQNSAFGTTPAEAVSFGGAQLIFATAGLLGIAAAVALAVFMTGRVGRQRVRRR